jgi:hypothetical protein
LNQDRYWREIKRRLWLKVDLRVRLVNNWLKGRQKSKIDFECQRSAEIGVFESILNEINRIRCKHEKFMRQFQKILLFCDCYWWIFECGHNKQSNNPINSVSSRDLSVADCWIRFGVDVMLCYVKVWRSMIFPSNCVWNYR